MLSPLVHSTRSSTYLPSPLLAGRLNLLGNDVISIVFTYLPLRSHHALFLTCRQLVVVARRPTSFIHFEVPSTMDLQYIKKIENVLRYQSSIRTLDVAKHRNGSLEEFRRRDITPHRLILDDFSYTDDLASWIRRVPEVWLLESWSVPPRFQHLDNLLRLSCENFRPCDLLYLPTSLLHLDLTFGPSDLNFLAVEDAGWYHVTHALSRLHQLHLRLFPSQWNTVWWLSLKRMTSLHTLTVSNLGPDTPLSSSISPSTSTSTPYVDLDIVLLPTLRHLDIVYATWPMSYHWPTSRESVQWSRWMPHVEHLTCRGFDTPPDISTWTYLRSFTYATERDSEMHLSKVVTTTTTTTLPAWPLTLLQFTVDMREPTSKKGSLLWPLYITRLGRHLTDLTLIGMRQKGEEWIILGEGLPHLRSLSLFECRFDLSTFHVFSQHFSGLDRFRLIGLSTPIPCTLFTKWTSLVELEWSCQGFDDTLLTRFAHWCPRSVRSLTTRSSELTSKGILCALPTMSPHLQHWYLPMWSPTFSPLEQLAIDSSACTLHY